MSNGEVRQIARDIDVGGATAFTKGEQVVIERTVPNPERPEYEHVVFSRVTGKWFQLRDEDLEAPQYLPPQGADPSQYFAPGDAFQQGVITSGPPVQFASPSDAFSQPYGAAQTHRPPLAQTRTMSRQDETRIMWFSSGIAALGLLIVITTFLPWLNFMGLQLGSGWNAMLHGSSSGGGFSLFVHGDGVIFFTGFWSIAVGLAVITGGVCPPAPYHAD